MAGFQSLLNNLASDRGQKRPQKTKTTVREALKRLQTAHEEKMIGASRSNPCSTTPAALIALFADTKSVNEEAIRQTEESGIVFLDEIDKLAAVHGVRCWQMCLDFASGLVLAAFVRQETTTRHVKGEGVQKELLSLIEGTTVNTVS